MGTDRCSFAFAFAFAPMVLGLFACSRGAGVTQDDSFAVMTAPQLIEKVESSHPRAVLINAWATWCDSCQHELPMLQTLAARFAERGVRVVLVSVDEPAQRPEIEHFLEANKITLKSYIAAPPLSDFKVALNPRWPGMLPASFLFDGAGKLRYFWGGEAFENEVVPVAEGLLAGKAIDGETRFDLAPGQTSTH